MPNPERRPMIDDAIGFVLNGAPVSAMPAPGERLSNTLRERLGARDVKIGCDAGDCGACTVLLNGEPVCACLTPTHQIAGARIETAAGLARRDDDARKLRAAFARRGAAQCGVCTPGMIASAVALLRKTPTPSLREIEDALGGVLCRCTGYRAITEAVAAAHAEQGDPAVAGGVGAASARIDGRRKIVGRELFADDLAPPATRIVKIIRSPFAHAKFEFGDLHGFIAARPGLDCVLTAEDVPGRNAFGVIPGFEDQPVFAEIRARHRGEAVAAVVGAPDAIRALDLKDFPVSWRDLPAVAKPAEAVAATAPQLHDHAANNVMCGGFVKKGDAAAALARADVVVEGRYRTGFVEHAYIEPEAGYARMVGDRYEIHACTQAPVMDREQLARILDVPENRIRIAPTAVGGGFGSKLDISVQPFLALAAKKTGQPVRITYTRQESMQATTKRHPSDIRLRIGATRDGALCGFDFEGDFNTGAYASWGPTVANRVPVHASGPYLITDYRARSRAIYTNNPPAGAFRGFGTPQSAIAQEALFDLLAERLGLDPLEFRLRNVLVNGAPTVTGQIFEQGVGVRACLEALRPGWLRERAAAAAFNAQARASDDPRRRGAGVAAGWYGCGNTSLPNPSTIKAGVRADGALALHQGAIDIGQGANTVIAQIFATALGVGIEDLELIGADTDVTPDAGKTSASRQTFVSGNAARLSGAALRDKILRRSNASADARIAIAPGSGKIMVSEGARMHEIALGDLKPDADGYVLAAQESYDPPTRPLDENGQGAPYAQFGYAAQIAMVEVDTKLGTVAATKFIAAHDVGRAINPMLVEGQVQGGIAQGLGMALMEEYIPGRSENLHDYLIPTIGDIPDIETLIIEEPDAHGPYAAKGLGEHVLIPTAPAIFNAIRHATGAVLDRAPATPERVLAAVKLARDGARRRGER